MLSALAHGPRSDTRTAVDVFAAAQFAIDELPTDRAMLDFDLVRAALSEAARKVIDAMIPEGYKYKSDLALKWMAEGKAEGKAEGEARALLAVLEARGLALTEEQRERILSCNDLAQLDRWVRKAVSVANASEIFA